MRIGWRHPFCPSCGSNHLHLSRRRGAIERAIYSVLSVAPYRCDDCYERHFRMRLPKGPGTKEPRVPTGAVVQKPVAGMPRPT